MARGDKVVGIRPGVEPAGESFDPAPLIAMFERHIESAKLGEIREACIVSIAPGDASPGYEVASPNRWAMSAYLHWVAQDIADAEAMGDEVDEE